MKEFKDKFMTQAKFSTMVEDVVKNSNGLVNYIDAVIVVCDELEIEVDTVTLNLLFAATERRAGIRHIALDYGVILARPLFHLNGASPGDTFASFGKSRFLGRPPATYKNQRTNH